jgi:2-haloacid dehalogenase
MPRERYSAVIFDLLTALLDSWSLWEQVAGSEQSGYAWRARYLDLTYRAGAYRPYEDIIREAARAVGLPAERADELVGRWSELKPWRESRHVVYSLMDNVPVAIATNSSVALADIAMDAFGVPVPIVVTAEEAGYYKPHPQPYRVALQRLGCSPDSVLFVAGSAADVPGASAAGMDVYWHNRRRLDAVDTDCPPRYVSDSLWRVLELV